MNTPNCKRMYAIRDDKMAEFDRPCIIQNDDVACRMLGDTIRNCDKSSALALHPEDFTMWFIGFFDATTGAIQAPEDGACIVCRGSDFVNKE